MKKILLQLAMTCQPAVKVGFLFSMAVNAESHLKAVTLEPLHGLHRTVALLTGNLLPYVALMIEQYMLRQVVDFLPRSRRFVVEIPVLLLDPRMVGNDVLVAVETLLHRWYSRLIRISGIGMTKLTLDPLHPHVNLMAERNRLFRAYVGGVIIEKVKEQDGGTGGKEGEEQGPPVPLQRLQKTVL
jgi:hypothetical protein